VGNLCTFLGKKVLGMEIEVYAQGKRFMARSLEELDLILKHFKGWRGGEKS
jgi:hypothetical protein